MSIRYVAYDLPFSKTESLYKEKSIIFNHKEGFNSEGVKIFYKNGEPDKIVYWSERIMEGDYEAIKYKFRYYPKKSDEKCLEEDIISLGGEYKYKGSIPMTEHNKEGFIEHLKTARKRLVDKNGKHLHMKALKDAIERITSVKCAEYADRN
ncbi:MAG: hypothetical protein ABIH00_01710 [Armatimonadota bacterium]